MCEQDVNKESYNNIADIWDEGRRKSEVDPVVVRLASMLPRGGRILDIGCGTGYPIDSFLDEQGFIVTGIDQSENMLSKAVALGLINADFILQDFFSYETDEHFDAVIAFDSIFHIALDRQPDIYPKVSSLLKTGGLFLFTHGKVTGTVEGCMFGKTFSYSALDSGSLKGCLADAGLEIIWFIEDYSDPVTGSRDLVVLARKY